MSVRPIREHDGKEILHKWLPEMSGGKHSLATRSVLITPEILDRTSGQTWDGLLEDHPWLLEVQLVAKPDQLIKRRGKAGLLIVNKSFEECKQWIVDRMCREQKVEHVTGTLTHFILEPFVKHNAEEEHYVCMYSTRYADKILFYHEGGVDVGDVDAKAECVEIPHGAPLDQETLNSLLVELPKEKKGGMASFITALFAVYREVHFAYLEINPLVMLHDGSVVPLDLAGKIDETAEFLCGPKWGELDWPTPFGRDAFPEEKRIRDLDGKTGASLKLTVLNDKGRVWTMVAGGGASVVYADTVADYGFGHELANYGEYSGAPTAEETRIYASTVFELMTKYKHPDGKALIIGGGIANFTDVAATFTGLIKALESHADKLKEHGVKIWIRRAGPNYLEGLRKIKAAGQRLGLFMRVYGPETHITACIPMALGLQKELPEADLSLSSLPPPVRKPIVVKKKKIVEDKKPSSPHASALITSTPDTTSIVYGMQNRAVQGMLDFDNMCKRKKPSVSAIVFPFGGNHYVKFYWGTEEILMPVYTTIAEAVSKHPDVSIMVNFASFRSVHETSIEALKFPNLRTICLIAEGVPERQTRDIIQVAESKGVGVIGPATVGGIKPGCMRLGNTGGMLDNIVMSRLYRPGSVAYVSKSGGMSNELNNMICRHSNGVYEGVAIGGDRYPGSHFLDHMLRYQADPDAKILVLLGEVGGVDEYAIIEAVRDGRITKPMIAWCVGTCASCFTTEVQFGHAGAQARGDSETAAAKNAAMKEAGINVPKSFDGLPQMIEDVYTRMVEEGDIVEVPEAETPQVPVDFSWAKKLGMVRKPANFISSIADDRGEELKYCGITISDVFSNDLGIGGVLSLLWFRRQLPPACTKFIEMVLMITADHGPAVSGAHNTIVTARAGKDLVSALCSGLLTIGPRFGGALDDAGKMFADAHDSGIMPAEFVDRMKKQNKLIMGIGHRIKSLANPDKRVVIIKEYAKKNFTSTSVLDFALAVEQVTTKKRANLILNVDGCIAVCFVDMMRSCGAFSPSEAQDLLEFGCLNGLFVLGRSIGFIGHHLDQLRLKQPLYRHPWDDISYIEELAAEGPAPADRVANRDSIMSC
jgi:ATP citrate (pro-S)-lyase